MLAALLPACRISAGDGVFALEPPAEFVKQHREVFDHLDTDMSGFVSVEDIDELEKKLAKLMCVAG
eukprot:SAG22_NODE_12173_length_454_cov_0.543662_1_plen_65_part_01